MKIRSKIGIGICVIAVIVGGVIPAHAEEPRNAVSRVVKLGIAKLPCDGVAYPVAESWNSYTEALRTPNILVKGGVQKLTYASETWTLDSVSDAYTNEVSLTLDLVSTLFSGSKVVFGVKQSRQTTYTHSTTVVPKEINELSVTAKIDGVKATPTAFKLEGWGQYYRCDVGATRPVQVGGLNTVKFDVTQATGWVLERSDGLPLSESDIS